MSNFFEDQKTIGIVGSGLEVNAFIRAAHGLGHSTIQLIEKSEESLDSNADKILTGYLSEPAIQKDFVMAVDLLLYFDHSIEPAELENAQKAVVIPQGADLLAIAQDRSLQKAFYESIGVNIAPYEMIVNEEDIKEALPSLGYPSVLRRNVIQADEFSDSYFIYEEDDIEKASELLKHGPAVLESWIVSEHQLAITTVKAANGGIQLYPVVEKHYQNERLSKIMKAELDNEELIEEIERAAELIVSNINFVGVLTIEFVVSPSQALYLGRLHPYPSLLSRYSEGNPFYSSRESHLRAVTSLPLAPIDPAQVDYAYYPLYADQKEAIEEALLKEANGLFYFFPRVKTGEVAVDDVIGYFLSRNKNWTL